MKPGDKGTVYDRYNFAIPLACVVSDVSDANDGIEVVLLESNNVKFPVGSLHWVHARQFVRGTPTGVKWEALADYIKPSPLRIDVDRAKEPSTMCPMCKIAVPWARFVDHFHDHAVLSGVAK
jgi:hypothetical protein